nr:von Willebrand factor-like [Onthophagus taurus]
MCFGEADVTGDPHYTTFDGKRFDFMGKCVYYLVKGLDFFITADHYVWQNGQFVKDFKSPLPSWTKMVEVHHGDNVVSLKPNLVVTFNNKPLTKFPHKESNITVSKPTGSKIIVELPNYLQVHWDGQTTAKIRAPTTMRGYLQGLMGNFNKDPKDDFVLPNGDLVDDPNVFGHSWKVEGSCEEENTDPIPDPCQNNPAHKRDAEKACSILNGNLFSGCKDHNSKESYDSCVYDCCHADDLGDKCACEIIAAHAGRCLNKSNQWRKQVPACEIKCPAGLVYNYCLNPCESSCDYIAVNPTCQKQCLEGCGCPEGKTLDENNKCVEIENCKCKLNGKYFPKGYKITEDKFIKTCTKAKWIQSPNNDPNNKNINSIDDLKAKCKDIKNSVYTPCKSSNSLTCKNMDKSQDDTTNNKCEEGCECEEGFVLDTKSNSCVLPQNCPCFFNGRSYDDLAERKIFNGKCICKSNKWECTKKENAVEKCSIFGDSIRNFDGKIISFNSGCEFVLANGEFNKKPYSINIKSGEVFMSYTDDENNNVEIEIKKNAATFNNEIDLQSTKIVDLDSIGIQIIWTKEGYHLKFKPENIENVVGLCGKLEDPDTMKDKDNLIAYIDSWNNEPSCFDTINIPTVCFKGGNSFRTVKKLKIFFAIKSCLNILRI